MLSLTCSIKGVLKEGCTYKVVHDLMCCHGLILGTSTLLELIILNPLSEQPIVYDCSLLLLVIRRWVQGRNQVNSESHHPPRAFWNQIKVQGMPD